MINEEGFLQLINDNNGFEYTLGFRGDEDHIIGGTGNAVWYVVMKGRKTVCRLAEKKDGAWSDVCVTKAKTVKRESAPAGKTIAMILDRVNRGQQEILSSGRGGTPAQVGGYSVTHYSFAFGERAYDILDGFGVTAALSDLAHEEEGFRVRYVSTGEAVTLPRL